MKTAFEKLELKIEELNNNLNYNLVVLEEKTYFKNLKILNVFLNEDYLINDNYGNAINITYTLDILIKFVKAFNKELRELPCPILFGEYNVYCYSNEYEVEAEGMLILRKKYTE